MGKDQRGKKHGLDVRQNAKVKAEVRKLLVDPAYQRGPKQHRGQR